MIYLWFIEKFHLLIDLFCKHKEYLFVFVGHADTSGQCSDSSWIVTINHYSDYIRARSFSKFFHNFVFLLIGDEYDSKNTAQSVTDPV